MPGAGLAPDAGFNCLSFSNLWKPPTDASQTRLLIQDDLHPRGPLLPPHPSGQDRRISMLGGGMAHIPVGCPLDFTFLLMISATTHHDIEVTQYGPYLPTTENFGPKAPLNVTHK